MLQRLLNREQRNAPKIGILIFIWAGSMLLLSTVVSSVGDPLFGLAVLPLLGILVAERTKKLGLFEGMTVPALVVALSSHIFIWSLNSPSIESRSIPYLAAGLFVIACVFCIVRILSYEPDNCGDAGGNAR